MEENSCLHNLSEERNLRLPRRVLSAVAASIRPNTKLTVPSAGLSSIHPVLTTGRSGGRSTEIHVGEPAPHGRSHSMTMASRQKSVATVRMHRATQFRL